MTIKILAFGIAKDILGGASVSVPLEEGASVAALKNYLAQQYPALQRLSSFMIAVNGEYANIDTIIEPDDEIAIIPPVSGG
jgi:molybdopterin synthase sulfur carrier subunit